MPEGSDLSKRPESNTAYLESAPPHWPQSPLSEQAMKTHYLALLLSGMAFSCLHSIAADQQEKVNQPVLELYAASKEAKEGYTPGQYKNDKSLFCGPKIDFTEYIAKSSCSRQPGENAPYLVFVFLDEAGGQKLKTLTKESLHQFVAIDVNGESVGLSKVEVVHGLVEFNGKKRGLITFSVGQNWKKGEALAEMINAAAAK